MSTSPLYRDFASVAEIDAQYNVGVTLADAGIYLRGYADRSRETRDKLRGELDIAYGATLDETLDIFPADRPGAPVFVFIHGGYWRGFSSKDFSCVALGVQATGITTVVVNYSLCPKVTIDEITRQCRAALAWTFRHIATHGGDPAHVAVGGHSAGGHLSAMCLEARWDEDYGLARDPLAAAVLVSGIYDLAPMRHSYLQPSLHLDDGVIARNSPLFAIRPCATPLLVTWGGDESAEFARQSTSFHDAWQAAGNASELLPQPGANHFSATDGFEDASSPICRWLADRLSATR
jgi:arylformamidase